MQATPQIVVIGAGAMGLLYAGLLAPHCPVTILDSWSDQIDALKSRGLTLTGVGGTKRPSIAAVHQRDAETIRSSADIVIALTGAGGSPAAAEAAAIVLRPEGYLLTLQNGVGNIEAYEAKLGSGRVLAGLSYHSGILRGLAHAEQTHRGPTWLGEIDKAKTARLAALIALMNRAGAEPPQRLQMQLMHRRRRPRRRPLLYPNSFSRNTASNTTSISTRRTATSTSA